jgi:putative acetyltransferase
MFMSRQETSSDHLATRAAANGLTVRRTRVTDAEAYARLMADPEVYANLLQMPWPSPDHWQARLTESCAHGSLHVQIVAEADGKVVGAAGLHPVGASPRKRHVMALGINVDVDWQGRGVGALLMQSLCEYADRWLGLLRVELDVYADNQRAQALYERFGFVREGLQRCAAMRDGVYVDSLSMARLNPAPLRGFPRD